MSSVNEAMCASFIIRVRWPAVVSRISLGLIRAPCAMGKVGLENCQMGDGEKGRKTHRGSTFIIKCSKSSSKAHSANKEM